jgi:hypothetical protein
MTDISKVPYDVASLLRVLIELDYLLQHSSPEDQHRALALLGIEGAQRVTTGLIEAIHGCLQPAVERRC